MRTLSRAGVLAVASSAALFVAPVAHADTHNGDNGTVKIHDAKTGQELHRNEPHVCTFYLDAFGFDGGQKVNWHIDVWAPTAGVKGTEVKSGDLALDKNGHGRTEDLSLPDGHYKLFWNFDGENGNKAKQKVFWTDCKGSEAGGTTPSGSGSPSESSGSSGSGSPSDSPSDSASSSASSPAQASPSASPGSSSGAAAAASSSPSAQGGAGGDLAETGNGAPVGLLSGVAAALLAAGGFLALRRRKAGQS